jgi:16S rRNA (adenine1518-N6/adenine1519-N6)-dimethyltransferase
VSRPRLGQHFLADPNLLDAIVREAGLREDDVVLEIGAGAGALTERLAAAAGRVHAIELDRNLEQELGGLAGSAGNVTLHWGDAMKIDLASLDPPPAKVVSNLPYSIATPVILRTIEQLPAVTSWTLMVQREIADRLRAGPRGRDYGAPSVLVQLACEVRLLRPVGRRVFTPPPRVDSALIGLTRRGPGVRPAVAGLVRGAFAHRRKALARSLELAGVQERAATLGALERAGLAADSRAEALSPEDFSRLATELDASPTTAERGRAR